MENSAQRLQGSLQTRKSWRKLIFLCPCYCNIQEQLILLTVPLLVFMSSKLAWEKITVLSSNCLVMLPMQRGMLSIKQLWNNSFLRSLVFLHPALV